MRACLLERSDKKIAASTVDVIERRQRPERRKTKNFSSKPIRYRGPWSPIYTAGRTPIWAADLNFHQPMPRPGSAEVPTAIITAKCSSTQHGSTDLGCVRLAAHGADSNVLLDRRARVRKTLQVKRQGREEGRLSAATRRGLDASSSPRGEDGVAIVGRSWGICDDLGHVVGIDGRQIGLLLGQPREGRLKECRCLAVSGCSCWSRVRAGGDGDMACARRVDSAPDASRTRMVPCVVRASSYCPANPSPAEHQIRRAVATPRKPFALHFRAHICRCYRPRTQSSITSCCCA